ncbi:MAG TPA: CotH kinase family protein [Bacteroidia bacterium]|nr:CotH kinase family protein [Bacteroidia bacterium]
MIRLILSTFFTLIFSFVATAINLSGNITANTVLAGKINVTADVVVSSGTSLTFLDGATLIMSEGVSIIGRSGSSLIFSGSMHSGIEIKSSVAGTYWGKIEAEGSNATLEMDHVSIQGGHLNIISNARAILEDCSFRHYFVGDIPIIRAENAADFQMRRSIISNYYEVNIISSPALIEDCIFQFMTADGIDFDNSPSATILRRSVFRYGKGTNIDAIDFGKVDFMGNGSIGLVQQCLVHDISDKGVSIGEGAQEVSVEGCLFYNCGAGIAVKDNSYGRIYNNTFVNNDFAIELVEKNPGLGGGHGYTYNNIFRDNASSFYLNSTSTIEVRYSNYEDAVYDTLNYNFNSDPMFVDPVNRNYQLREYSPCIAAGLNEMTIGAYFPVGTEIPVMPKLQLGVPNSISVYSAGDTVNLSWSCDSLPGTVSLLFSDDMGDNWQTIATGIDASLRQYTWYVPAIYSTRCKIKISADINPAIQSENYIPFTISPLLNDSYLPDFSVPAGYYNSEINLTLSSQAGDIIYYSLDGSDPSDRSLLYSSPIRLASDSIPAGQAEQNITASNGPKQPYSYIRTAPVWQNGPNPAIWYKPGGAIKKANVVKARIYRPGVGLGPTVTKSYFVDSQMLNGRYTLPVTSLVTDPKNLFDFYSGVYIPGVDFTGYSFTGNYERKGRANEKPGHIEYFSPNGRNEFSKNIGFRIRGEWIRSLGQKALTIFARSEYDEQNEFDYELFPGLLKPGTKIVQNKYKRFVLRNAGSEWGWDINTMCLDMLCQSLFDKLDLKYQAGNPTVVFLNGEYWGLHNIRELNDKRGLEFSYGVNPDSVIMMEDNFDGPFQIVEGFDGDVQEFYNLRNFILQNDLNIPANYDLVKELMDIDNFIDYWAATVFANKQNTDHNTSYWKLRNGHPGPGVAEAFDGRWRWMANDFDSGLNNPADDNLGAIIYMMKDSLLKRLLTSNEFRLNFINRFADLLNSNFSTNHFIRRINYYQDLLDPEIEEHIARWGTPLNKSLWEQTLDRFRLFATERPIHQRDQIMTRFNVPDQHELIVDVSDRAMGTIQVNSLKINQALPGVDTQVYPWKGTYFENVPVSVSAQPYSGYKFFMWAETGETNPNLILDLQSDISRTAVFRWDPNESIFTKSIFPNPLKGSVLNIVTASQISIYDLTGRLILETKDEVYSVDLTNLNAGVYLVRLNGGDAISFVKL